MSTRVVVIGAGPAGHAAALAAASYGGAVTLVEGEALGGQCVNHTCIPSGLMLSAATAFAGAQELGVSGVFDAGDALRLGRAQARKDALVARLAGGVRASLVNSGVEILMGRARFVSPHRIDVAGREIDADAVVITTGTRWSPPRITGVPDRKVVTLDAVLTLDAPPGRTVVIGGGPASTAFAVESAFLLAVAGSAVTYVTVGGKVIPALDDDIDAVARGALEAIGVVVTDADPAEVALDADVVVAPDVREPHVEGLGLRAAGLPDTVPIAVDDRARTAVDHVFAAGDVTGGPMLSQVAAHAGHVAGTNAAGGNAKSRVGAVPHVLHTAPEVGWIGRTESAGRADGWDVATAVVDLAWSARAITTGGHDGALKLVADRELGAVLGVHVVGPEASEILAVAATAMQAELTVDDLAAVVHSHPSAAENLATAARMLCR